MLLSTVTACRPPQHLVSLTGITASSTYPTRLLVKAAGPHGEDPVALSSRSQRLDLNKLVHFAQNFPFTTNLVSFTHRNSDLFPLIAAEARLILTP